MIDREASSLRHRFEHNKVGYILGGSAAAALLAAGLYFGWFYTGWVGIPNTQYQYFVTQGKFWCSSWVVSGDDWYYTDRNAKMARGLYTIDGNIYLFAEDGKMQTGWQDTERGRMFFTGNGKARTGWSLVGGKYYYFSGDGVRQTGWLTLGENTYYLDEDGVRTVDWAEIDGKRYYFNADGIMCKGWEKIGKTWYLFADTGEMLTGDRIVEDALYHMDDEGKMITGWYETDGGWRWHDDSGAAVRGWKHIEGETYYFGEDYLMRTGLIEIDGEEFYTEEDGTVSAGWHESEDGDFFVCSDGYILDTEAETGNYGRLVIRGCGIDVAVNTTNRRDEYQEIVDEENSALAVKERRDDEYVIADRRSQGFDLDNVEEGTAAYFIETDGDIVEYVCSRALTGRNDGDDVLDDEGVSVWRQNEGGFCTYASAGTDDKEEVRIAFWILRPEEEEED